MKNSVSLILLTFALLCAAPAQAVMFDWATVGNPGNADDNTGFGGVDYTYRISKHEVTNAQYSEFLNTVDPTGVNPNSIYNPQMSSNANGGINFNGGAASGSKYEIKSGRDDNPAVFVSFFSAMRFTNWLENGQGSGGTESGVYTISNGLSEVRSANAKYWIPSEDEWYKAAYYDPIGVYYDYPTGTDTEPYSDNPGSLNAPDGTNVANFKKNDGIANGYDDGHAVTGSPSDVSGQNYLTDVGAYSSATSPYGTFDQGGNVREWNEAVIQVVAPSRGLRGGSWVESSVFLRSDAQTAASAGGSNRIVGFRMAAAVPEPSTMLLGALAAVGLLVRRAV